MMSSQGAKILTTDGTGNFYVATYSNAAGGDAVIKVGIGNLTATSAAVGTPSTTTNITTILNDEGCSPAPVVNFSALEGTASTTEFTAATTGSCNTVNGTGASFATTVTFTPAYGGTRTASLAATEAGGPGSTGSATVTGFATGQLAPPTFSPIAGTYHAVQTVNIYESAGRIDLLHDRRIHADVELYALLRSNHGLVDGDNQRDRDFDRNRGDEQRGGYCRLHDSTPRSDADLRSGGRIVQRSPDGDDLRCNLRRDDLLHDRRHDADDLLECL